MQIKGLHKSIYKLYGYGRKQKVLIVYRFRWFETNKHLENYVSQCKPKELSLQEKNAVCNHYI